MTNHSESDDEIFAWKKSTTATTRIKTSSPNKTSYQRLLLVY
jgi:hypothetical protein